MMKSKKNRNKKYLDWVRRQPCVITGTEYVEAHHLIGHGQSAMGSKSSDIFTFPLTSDKHVGNNGIHTIGIIAWESKYGSQWTHVASILNRAIKDQILDLDDVKEEIKCQVINTSDIEYLKNALNIELY